MKKITQKLRKGGERLGAGRPTGRRSVDEINRRIQFQVRLPRYVVEWLRSEKETATEIIERSLIEKHRNEIKAFEKNFRVKLLIQERKA